MRLKYTTICNFCQGGAMGRCGLEPQRALLHRSLANPRVCHFHQRPMGNIAQKTEEYKYCLTSV